MKPNETQLQKVRKHLQKKGFITSWYAISKFRITRLSQYILLLRKEGLDIESTRIYPEDKNKNWFTNYQLIKKHYSNPI